MNFSTNGQKSSNHQKSNIFHQHNEATEAAVAFDIKFNIWKNMSLFAEPSFRKVINSLDAADLHMSKLYYNFGIKVGVDYKF